MKVSKDFPLVACFDELNSTNTFIEEILKNFKDNQISNLIVFSKKQTMGKGRDGKNFFSPKGGLYFSILIKNFRPEPCFPLIVGIFFIKKLREIFKLPFYLRWPNDFIIYDKKFGGILIEVKGENCIIGVGINVERDVSENVFDQKTAYLNKFLEKKVKVNFLLKKIEDIIKKDFLNFIKNKIDLKEWENFSYFKKGDIVVWEEDGKSFEGIYEGINENGHIILKSGGKIKNFFSLNRIYKKEV